MPSAPSRGYQRLLSLAPDELAELRQRARELARVVEVQVIDEGLEVLEVQCRGQAFALPVDSVDGIVDLVSLASLPRAPPYCRGLVSFHGEVLLAIELGALLGASTVGFADLRRLVALRAGEAKLVVLAEKTLTVRTATVGSFRADPSRPQPFVRGTDERFVTLLQPAALIAHAFAGLGGGAP